jgi:hypothetical protein
MPSTMDDGKHDDLIWHRDEVDRVRKASHERSARLALDASTCKGGLDDAGKRLVHLRREDFTEARALFLVPDPSVE